MEAEFRGTERYAVARRIGAGGMGVVYEAQDRERGTRVALKTLRKLDPNALYRFKHEFRSLADVSHPNLVNLYELVSASSGWFFVMELIDGVDFLEWVRAGALGGDDDGDTETATRPCMSEGGSDPPETIGQSTPAQPTQSTDALDEAVITAAAGEKGPIAPAGPAPHLGRLRDALLQLADGVNALHAAGKLHRDIKPSNVLVASDGRVVLLDFGLATGFDRRETDTTFRGKLVGTVGYVSPEQCAGRKPTTRSDWYAVGVVLYHALVGRLPFTGSPARVLAEKRRIDPPAPRTIRPSTPADLNDLCMALLDRDPEKRPDGAAVLRVLGRDRVRAPLTSSSLSGRLEPGALVGRNSHLKNLKNAFDTACASQAVTVYVRGLSGMGKTALVQYFVDGLAENHGAMVIRGRANERESVPYRAFDSFIDALSRQLLRMPADECAAVVPDDAWAIARLFPVLARVPAVREVPEPAEGIPSPAVLRRKAFLALRALLDRLARTRKLVLFFDDLQWGDADSAELLIELMRPPQSPPLLFLGAWRIEDAESSPMVRALAHHRRVRGTEVVDVLVGPLRYADSHELALEMLGRDDADAREQAGSIAFEAKGSPCLVAELARWSLESRHGPSSSVSNVSLGALLDMRLANVSAGAHHALDLAAVSGHPVDVEALRRAAGLGDHQRDAIASLRAARLLRTGSRGGREVVEPYDDRLREVVIARMDPVRIRQAHEALALAYEALGTPDPEVLAAQWAAAGDAARCAHHAEIAADRASAAFAFAHAARLYQLALERLPPVPHRTFGLRLRLAEALANAGRTADAARAFREAAAGSTDDTQIVDLNRRAAELMLRIGQVEEGRAVLEQVLNACHMPFASGSAASLRRARFRRLQLSMRGLRFRERPESDVSPESLASVDVAWSAASGLALVDPVSATDYATRGLLLALGTGEPFRIARALCGEAIVAVVPNSKGAARARRVLDLARDIGQRTDDLGVMGLCALAAGTSALLQGQWKSARDWCARAEPILSELCLGSSWELGLARFVGLQAAFFLGELDPLRNVPELVADADARGDAFASMVLRVGLSNLAWLLRGDEDSAVHHLSAAQENLSGSQIDLFNFALLLGRANAFIYRGEEKRALESVRRRWRDLLPSPMLHSQLVRIQAMDLRGRCLLAAVAAGADSRSALERVDRTARSIESENAAWGRPLALLLCACAAQLSGKQERAVALFGQAEDACVQCGMAFPRQCRQTAPRAPHGRHFRRPARRGIGRVDVVARHPRALSLRRGLRPRRPRSSVIPFGSAQLIQSDAQFSHIYLAYPFASPSPQCRTLRAARARQQGRQLRQLPVA